MFIRKIFIISLILYSVSFTQNIKFAWLTDIHIGYPSSEKDLISSVNSINSFEDVSFTIVSGDITATGTLEELSLAKSILDKLNKPYFLIPGNHDTKWSESGCTDFIRLWGNDRFVFKVEEIVFIGLHQGPRMRMADGHFAPEDLRWFDSVTISLSEKEKVIFITHYPLDESISNWYEITERLKRINTQFVLFGHGHRNKLFNFEGIEGIMGRSNLSLYSDASGYNLVEIKKDSVFFFEKNSVKEELLLWHYTNLEIKDYTLQNDFIRPDYSINSQYNNIKVMWKHNTGYTIGSSAIVSDNSIFIGDVSGKFYSLDIESGKIRWIYKTRNSIYSTAAVCDNYLVFGSADSSIYCLHKNNGNLIWEFRTQAAILGSPLIYDNKVFIGGSDRKFRALDLLSGKLIWEFGELKGFVESKPVFYDNKIFFGAWDEHFYCLDYKTGNLIWKWKGDESGIFLSPAVCQPVISNEVLFLVAPSRKITALDIHSGKEYWKTNKYKVRETIGISKSGDKIFLRTMNDTILAIPADKELKEPLWITNCGFGYDISSAQIIENNGVIFYPNKNGVIYSLDSNNGELFWKYKISNVFINTLTFIDRNNLIATDFDGNVSYIRWDEK